MNAYLAPENSALAIIPATGGKKNVLANRTQVIFHPSIAISMGIRLIAHNDHPLRNATMVPILAPD